MEKSPEKEICTFIEELEANLLIPHRIENPELAEELFQVAKKNTRKRSYVAVDRRHGLLAVRLQKRHFAGC